MKNDDFYIDNGKYVFTEKFLLARGYCCGNGCRHCPYNYENIKDDKKKLEMQQKKTNELPR